MTIYRFSTNRVLWAQQWSNHTYLLYQPAYGAKKHVYQVLLKYLNLYSTYGKTDEQTGTRNSTRLFILIIYINTYTYITQYLT